MKTINDCTILVVDDTKANVAVLVQALRRPINWGSPSMVRMPSNLPGRNNPT